MDSSTMLLRLPNGDAMRLKVRSMVGLLPLCAASVFEPKRKFGRIIPGFEPQGAMFIEAASGGCATFSTVTIRGTPSAGECCRSAMKRSCARSLPGLDENEFFSPYGIRCLSKYHEHHPFVIQFEGNEFRVYYVAGESDSGMFGGNSNWRGPIWMPVNFLLIRSLLNYYAYYGNDFQIEYPTGSGKMHNLYEIVQDLISRLVKMFTRDENGLRPIYGNSDKFQNDPHWRDLILS